MRLGNKLLDRSNTDGVDERTLGVNADSTHIVEKSTHLKKRAAPKKFIVNFTLFNDKEDNLEQDEN